MPDKRANQKFVFLGNNLCLDFVNTKIIRGGRPTDLLGGFTDFMAWLVEAQVIGAAEAEEIEQKWESKPEAAYALARALEFRVALHNLAERIIRGRPAPTAAIAAINELLRYQVGYTELKRTKGGFEKRLHARFAEPIYLLYPIAESASDLLCYSDPSLIKKCEGDTCVIFFYDTTKNHSRRWCSMAFCGNREKVAAHYRRLRVSKER